MTDRDKIYADEGTAGTGSDVDKVLEDGTQKTGSALAILGTVFSWLSGGKSTTGNKKDLQDAAAILEAQEKKRQTTIIVVVVLVLITLLAVAVVKMRK